MSNKRSHLLRGIGKRKQSGRLGAILDTLRRAVTLGDLVAVTPAVTRFYKRWAGLHEARGNDAAKVPTPCSGERLTMHVWLSKLMALMSAAESLDPSLPLDTPYSAAGRGAFLGARDEESTETFGELLKTLVESIPHES
jgi:hypothetical protein